MGVPCPRMKRNELLPPLKTTFSGPNPMNMTLGILYTITRVRVHTNAKPEEFDKKYD